MLRIAIRNLMRSKVRTFFTVLGVAATMSMFVSLTTVGLQLTTQFDKSLAADQVDIIVQAKNAGTPFSSYMDRAVVDRLSELPGVRTVSSLILASWKLKGRPALYVFGVSSFAPVAGRMGVGLVDGRTFTPGTNELLLGQKVAKRFNLNVGGTVTFDDKNIYTVSGIYSLGIDYLDGGIFLDIEQARKLLNRQKMINMAFVTVHDDSNIAGIIGNVNGQFPDLLAIPGGELTRHVNNFNMIKTLVNSIGIITVLVGSILVLNTLLMAISERTKEIGILMAIGWSRLMIMTTIFYESLIMCVAGAISGFFMTYPLLGFLNTMPVIGPSWLPENPLFELFPVAIFLGGALGMASALYPALFATRLLPARSLGYE